jgi:hypothetical protein
MKVPSAACFLALIFALGGCMSYMGDPTGAKPEFKASLYGANEVPPVPSAGYGVMEARYLPTKQVLEWRIYFGNLSGPITWAYLQGPDSVGNDRADMVPINPSFDGNIQRGSVTLTEAQAADLMAGKWSVELRTEQYPAGEIRGNLEPVSYLVLLK